MALRDEFSLPVEPAAGEAEKALGQEDHHGDKDDAEGNEVGELGNLRQVEGGGEPREKPGEALAQAKEDSFRADKKTELKYLRNEATKYVEAH